MSPPVLPLSDEPHVSDWRRYLRDAGERPFERLQGLLPQLAIPVREGVSRTRAYRDVLRRGAPVSTALLGGPLRLAEPRALRLTIESHPAGALPVLATPCRRDFETLVSALAFHHEPRRLPPSVNAQTIAGLVNWDRVRRYRERWSARQGEARDWPAEMARVAREEPGRFFDRLLLVCDRPYGGARAADLGLGLSEAEWLGRSHALRVEHELTHYATKRVFGVMSANLLDELLADFMGFTRALGRFEAGWFLRCLGLDGLPRLRRGGRVHAYTAGLTRGAVSLLCELAAGAALGVEALSRRRYREADRTRFFLALCSLRLDLLAGPERDRRFERAWEDAGGLLRAPAPGGP